MSYPRDLDEFDERELFRELSMRLERRAHGLCDYCARDRTEPPCKFPERHTEPIDIQELRAATTWWESPLINRDPRDIYLTAKLRPRCIRTRDEHLLDFILRAYREWKATQTAAT